MITSDSTTQCSTVELHPLSTETMSAPQGLDDLLNLMSLLLGGKTQPTIHEDDSNNESILSNITDAKLEESGLKFESKTKQIKPCTNYLTKPSTNLPHHQCQISNYLNKPPTRAINHPTNPPLSPPHHQQQTQYLTKPLLTCLDKHLVATNG